MSYKHFKFELDKVRQRKNKNAQLYVWYYHIAMLLA